MVVFKFEEVSMKKQSLSPKHRLKLSIISTFCLMFAFGCSQVFEKNTSRVKSLTEIDFECWQPDKLRLDQIKTKIPEDFIKNFKNDDVYERFAGLPDTYLDYLID